MAIGVVVIVPMNHLADDQFSGAIGKRPESLAVGVGSLAGRAFADGIGHRRKTVTGM